MPQLYESSGYLIINDSNFHTQLGVGEGDNKVIDINGQPMSFGHKPRTFEPGIVCAPAPTVVIPRSEWDARIEEQESTKSDLQSISDAEGIECLDQNGTNYCHANSPALAIMINRAVMGLPYVKLSPGSVGGPITGYRNQGANIGDDLKRIISHGIAPQSFVPPNQINKSGWKPGAEQAALDFKVTDWFDMMYKDSTMFDRCATQLLLNRPVCVAYNWWSHAVTLIKLVKISNGKYGFMFRNSWGTSYGKNGYGILEEGKGTPNEAYVLLQVTINP